MAEDKTTIVTPPTTAEEEIANIKVSATETKMSDDGTVYRPLVYPVSENNRYGARVSFIPQLITGPQLDGVLGIGDLLKTVGKGFAKVITPEDVTPEASGEDSGTQEQDPDKANDDSTGPQITKGVSFPLTTKKVVVYLPIAFTASDTFTYDSPSLGAGGAILNSALSNAQGGAGEVLGNAVGDFIKLFEGAGGTSANSLAKLGAAKLAKRGPTEVGDGAAAALRVTADPNIRTLFRGVAVRQFAFQFKFIAKNSKEAQEIKAIIKRLRFYSYPESIQFSGSGAEAISVGFKYPHPFVIKTEFVDEDKNIFNVGPKIKECYLTSISTNFNPSTMAFHRDGEPVEIDLSLNFTEETTLSKTDILAGY